MLSVSRIQRSRLLFDCRHHVRTAEAAAASQVSPFPDISQGHKYQSLRLQEKLLGTTQLNAVIRASVVVQGPGQASSTSRLEEL